MASAPVFHLPRHMRHCPAVIAAARRRLPLLLGVGVLALAGCAHDLARYEAKPLDPAKSAAAFEARTLDDPGLKKFFEANKPMPVSALAGIPGLSFLNSIPSRNGRWNFEQLCLVAFYFNPALDVARAQWESARAAQATAGQRPNPTLTLTPGFNANPNGASPWLPAVGLDFALDPKAQRDRRTEIAQLNAEAARQAVLDTAWQVRADLRRTRGEFRLAETRAKALRAQADQQQKIVVLWELRRAGGVATASEVATAKLALLKSENAAADAEGQVAPVLQRLAQVLGLPGREMAELSLQGGGDNIGGFSLDELARLRGEALRSRSDVLGALARYASAEAALALEVERQHPGLRLGPGYQFDQGQNKWTVAFSFELPIFNRNQGPLAEAEARRREAEAQLVAAQAQAIAEIDLAEVSRITVYKQRARLETVLGATQSQNTAAEARRRAGAGDQLEVENTRLELAVASQASQEAELQAMLAYAQLEDALRISNSPFLKNLNAGPSATLSQKSP